MFTAHKKDATTLYFGSPSRRACPVGTGEHLFGVAVLTEAAVVGAFMAMLPALAHRGHTWSGLKEVIIGTAKVTGNHLCVFNIKS